MITLGIETATSICSVGLADGGKVLADVSEDAGRRHSVVLTGLIDRVLKTSGLQKEDLDGIAVSAGPGSFTGLRIGMGLAKGICLAADLPLAVVSTLHALTEASGVEAASVCACLDARHGEVYSGVYERKDDLLTNSLKDAGRPVDDLLTVLGPDTTVVGFEIDDHADRFRDAGFRILADVDPNGGAVALVGEQILTAGGATPLPIAEPNYCRRSQAERLKAGERA